MSDAPYTKVTADVDQGNLKWVEQLTIERRAAVERAGIVLVPFDGFRDYTGAVFPEGTVDFLQFLREHAPSGTVVAIAVEDADYKEATLHSDIVRLSTLFVEYVAAPVATSLIAAYLWDRLGSRFGRAEARVSIVLRRKDGELEESVRISYEGPSQSVESSLTKAIASVETRTGSTSPGTLPNTSSQSSKQRTMQAGTKKKVKRRK